MNNVYEDKYKVVRDAMEYIQVVCAVAVNDMDGTNPDELKQFAHQIYEMATETLIKDCLINRES